MSNIITQDVDGLRQLSWIFELDRGTVDYRGAVAPGTAGKPGIGGSMAFRSRRYYRLMRSDSRRWSLISVLRIGGPRCRKTQPVGPLLAVANPIIPRAPADSLARIVITVFNERPDSCHLPTPTCNERSFISLVPRTRGISDCLGIVHSRYKKNV